MFGVCCFPEDFLGFEFAFRVRNVFGMLAMGDREEGVWCGLSFAFMSLCKSWKAKDQERPHHSRSQSLSHRIVLGNERKRV